MTKDEIRTDLEQGSKHAAERARIPELTDDQIDHAINIICEPVKLVALKHGDEVLQVQEYGSDGRDFSSKETGVWIAERHGYDTYEMGDANFSFPFVKQIAYAEARCMQHIQMMSIIPCFYGAMPNLGAYYQSQAGKWPSPEKLIRAGKLNEAREVQVQAATNMKEDIVYMGKMMEKAGADGLDYDTSAAYGDAEFWGVLKSVEQLSEECPLLPLEICMSGEMIFGMHGDIRYEGNRLAGMWPHEQGKMLEKAGASLWGAAILVNTMKSFPWNLGKALTFTIKCQEVNIPNMINLEMGVGAIPMTNFGSEPLDVVARAAKAMIEIGKVDGI